MCQKFDRKVKKLLRGSKKNINLLQEKCLRKTGANDRFTESREIPGCLLLIFYNRQRLYPGFVNTLK